MKNIFILSFIIFAYILIAQQIVINEVMYDPAGADGGYEWIELYNASSQNVNLSGWIIQKGGSTLEGIFTFSDIELNPNSYLLIGESNVQNADITTDLGFQNGGSATDGIRLISYDGNYTDTVLYDSPNSNSLPGDENDPGIYFAPDVSSGHSLSRKHDGMDTNNCETDFFECTISTPGEANFYPIDLAVQSAEIIDISGIINLIFEVVNLSTEDLDNYEATAEIMINSELFDSLELPEIHAGDTLNIQVELPEFSENYNIVSVQLNYLYDNEIENNIVMVSFLVNASPVIINEILFKPSENNCEWIELYNRSESGYVVDNFVIEDASGGEIRFFGDIPGNDFIVVVEDEETFLNFYPNSPSEKIIEAVSWTTLNNTEEALSLYDNFEISLEEVEYELSDWDENISLERVNFELQSYSTNWGPSVVGATPGARNSIFVQVLPAESHLSIKPNPFSPYLEERTIISFKLPEVLSSVTLRIFDLKGRMVNKLLNQQLQASSGEFIWDGNDKSGKRLPVGVYIILMEATSRADEKVYSETKTVVIGK
jgi:hypothetical protein